ncbi:MAG: hypothetical protein ACM3MK_08640 [Chitinophagales bacterium]
MASFLEPRSFFKRLIHLFSLMLLGYHCDEGVSRVDIFGAYDFKGGAVGSLIDILDLPGSSHQVAVKSGIKKNVDNC